ncbi:hypothetical protein C8R43DRAFT_816420, partial [Mycena crocata]
MTQRLQAMEDKGWIGVSDRKTLRALAGELKARTAPTIFQENNPKQEDRDQGLSGARTLAVRGTQRLESSQPYLVSEASSDLRGAKLSLLTQAMAYAGIRELESATSRRETDNNIKLVQTATKTNFTFVPTPAQIWTSIRTKDFSRQVKNFYWKSMHAAHRIGTFWKHIPECEERGICQFCDEPEDLEHIALKCRRPGQSQVWALAKELWLKK